MAANSEQKIEPVPAWDEHVPQVMYQNSHGREEIQIQRKHYPPQSNSAMLGVLNNISASNFKSIAVADYGLGTLGIYRERRRYFNKISQ